jgi:hypothetical protein
LGEDPHSLIVGNRKTGAMPDPGTDRTDVEKRLSSPLASSAA